MTAPPRPGDGVPDPRPTQPPAIALIGPMAAGKSSIGRKLAARLGRRFVDTDRRITASHGPIPALFAEHGEPEFRRLEAAAVAEAIGDGAVVALGGGAVLDERTQALLADVTVVLVTVTDRAAARRLRAGTRPLLDGEEQDDPIVAWRRIAAERDPIYRALAQITIDSSHRPMSGIVDELETWLAERGL